MKGMKTCPSVLVMMPGIFTLALTVISPEKSLGSVYFISSTSAPEFIPDIILVINVLVSWSE